MDNVTLIIPTVHHRADLFKVCLSYLDALHYVGPIIVSDHSPEEKQSDVAAVVREFSGLNIKTVLHDPTLHFLERLADCSDKSETEYVQLHADDDFLCLPGLALALKFLKDNTDYSACLGDILEFQFIGKEFVPIRSKQFQKVDHLAYDRLHAQLWCYSSVLYALRRRDEVIESFRKTVSTCPDVVFWQYLETMHCTAKGKIQVLNFPWFFRQTHARKWSLYLKESPVATAEAFPFILANPTFGDKFCSFVKAVNELAGIDEYFKDGLILSKTERKKVNIFCNSYTEFLLGRANPELTGVRYRQKRGDYTPNLNELSRNFRNIPEYAKTIALIQGVLQKP